MFRGFGLGQPSSKTRLINVEDWVINYIWTYEVLWCLLLLAKLICFGLLIILDLNKNKMSHVGEIFS